MEMECDQHLHIIFLPYMAPGHMMPMLDIARVITSHGNNIKATIITTPSNVDGVQHHNTHGNINDFGCQITFLTVSLPLKEVGLPEGCENLMYTSTRETTFKLFRAIEMLQPQLETLLIQNQPDCIVSDYLYPWTVEVANNLGIPRLAFSGGCFFNNCISYNLERYRPHDQVQSEIQEFHVPNLPDDITLTRSHLQDIVKGKTQFNELFERLRKAERNSFGVLMNSFYELERGYADYFRDEMGIRSWHIGPLFLFNTNDNNEIETSNGDYAHQHHSCLQWLDLQTPKSVLYICFGSLSRFTKPQIVEIASALKESGFAFIWVLGKVLKPINENTQKEEEEEDVELKEWWLPEGFEGTVKQNSYSLIIRGWAPQATILNHEAIGGFLTHCGWNSILEGISGGVPLITWPLFADQFYNEKLVTQVLKIGIEVGNMVWKAWSTDETELVEKKKIKLAITRVMGGNNEGENIQRKVQEFSKLAHKAVEKGGSSYNDIKALLHVLRLHKQNRILGD